MKPQPWISASARVTWHCLIFLALCFIGVALWRLGDIVEQSRPPTYHDLRIASPGDRRDAEMRMPVVRLVLDDPHIHTTVETGRGFPLRVRTEPGQPFELRVRD